MIAINLQKKTTFFPFKNKKKLLSICHKIITTSLLGELVEQHPTFNIILCNDKQITKINSKFLQHHNATDVICFDYSKEFEEKSIYAELIISLETAYNQANIYNTTFHEEVILYIIHGILHLCNYDDKTTKQQEKMRQAEQNMLTLVKNEFSLKDIFKI